MPTTLDLPGTEILWRGRALSLQAQMARDRQVLSRISAGEPLSNVLHDLLVEIETSAEHGLMTSILELSEDGQHLTHLAGPTLPDGFKKAIDGVQIGEGVGSCGTVVYRAAPVYVSDIANDPLWTDYRDVALRHNLQACWSTPITGMGGDILGTFAIYYDDRRIPGPRDIEAISAITLTVALAIERYRSDSKIRRLSWELSEMPARYARTYAVQGRARALTTPLNRLQSLLRDPLITGPDKQRALTEVGRKVLELARRRIAENGRLLDTYADMPLRLGVGSVFIDRFTQGLGAFEPGNIVLSSGICFDVADAFANRELDVAYVLDVRDNRQKLGRHIVAEHSIDLAWVKAADFQFVPGQPIPLAVYPGDRPTIDALEEAGADYRVMFSSQEYAAKLSAVKSGRYVTTMPRSLIELPFEEVETSELPSVPSASILIAVRGEATSERFKPVLAALAGLHA
jgi:GAF domain-containing protein